MQWVPLDVFASAVFYTANVPLFKNLLQKDVNAENATCQGALVTFTYLFCRCDKNVRGICVDHLLANWLRV